MRQEFSLVALSLSHSVFSQAFCQFCYRLNLNSTFESNDIDFIIRRRIQSVVLTSSHLAVVAVIRGDSALNSKKIYRENDH